jgi:hypothetical protein
LFFFIFFFFLFFFFFNQPTKKFLFICVILHDCPQTEFCFFFFCQIESKLTQKKNRMAGAFDDCYEHVIGAPTRLDYRVAPTQRAYGPWPATAEEAWFSLIWQTCTGRTAGTTMPSVALDLMPDEQRTILHETLAVAMKRLDHWRVCSSPEDVLAALTQDMSSLRVALAVIDNSAANVAKMDDVTVRQRCNFVRVALETVDSKGLRFDLVAQSSDVIVQYVFQGFCNSFSYLLRTASEVRSVNALVLDDPEEKEEDEKETSAAVHHDRKTGTFTPTLQHMFAVQAARQTTSAVTTTTQEKTGEEWDPTVKELKEVEKKNRGLRNSRLTLNFDRCVDEMSARISCDQRLAINAVIELRDNCFCGGSAGVGKTRVFQLIEQECKVRGWTVACTAATGRASLLINGCTLHRWAGVGLAREPVAELIKTIRSKGAMRGNTALLKWQTTEVLMFDETSMLSPDLLEKLDQIGRVLRNRLAAPFGGIRLMFFGDFCQLPPVEKFEGNGGGQKGKTRFAFDAPSWNELFPRQVQLTRVFRQRDAHFIDLLTAIRTNRLRTSHFETIHSRLLEVQFRALVKKRGEAERDAALAEGDSYDEAEERRETLEKQLYAEDRMKALGIEDATMISPYLADVDAINARKYAQLAQNPDLAEFGESTYVCDVQFNPALVPENDASTRETIAKYFRDNLSTDSAITLRVGCRVLMLTNTYSDYGVCNGSSGTVVSFSTVEVFGEIRRRYHLASVGDDVFKENDNGTNDQETMFDGRSMKPLFLLERFTADVLRDELLPPSGGEDISVCRGASSNREPEKRYFPVIQFDGVAERGNALGVKYQAYFLVTQHPWEYSTRNEDGGPKKNDSDQLSATERARQLHAQLESSSSSSTSNDFGGSSSSTAIRRGAMKPDVKAVYRQIPLIRGFALSVHRSQGMSIKKLVVRGDRCFQPGMWYVMASRAETLEGLYIDKFDKKTITVSPQAVEYYERVEEDRRRLFAPERRATTADIVSRKRPRADDDVADDEDKDNSDTTTKKHSLEFSVSFGELFDAYAE